MTGQRRATAVSAAAAAAARTPAAAGPGRRWLDGFTLVEVLVALSIVAIALAAGAQAMGALTRNAQRQSDLVLGQLCVENELVKLRLSPQMPSVGDSTVTCEQASQTLNVALKVRPTPNPLFRRVDAQALLGEVPLLTISTVVGRY